MNLKNLEKKLGVNFNDISLLQQAVTHCSYCNEHRGEKIIHYERLEFLGDAVLELVITDHLMDKFPKKDEGELTELRSSIVKGVNLTTIAESIGVEEHLLLSKGEARDTKSRGDILADVVEAIIGAIYKDQGIDCASDFIAKLFFKKIDAISPLDLKSPKSRLQEVAQEIVGITPHYKNLSESGPDHNKTFVVGAYLGEKMVSKGSGPSKRAAEEDAAARALQNL